MLSHGQGGGGVTAPQIDEDSSAEDESFVQVELTDVLKWAAPGLKRSRRREGESFGSDRSHPQK